MIDLSKMNSEQRYQAKRRSQKKWYLKHQAYRHKYHLKSSKSHLKSNKRWMRKHRNKQIDYQKKSYCKYSILHASPSDLSDFELYYQHTVQKISELHPNLKILN